MAHSIASPRGLPPNTNPRNTSETVSKDLSSLPQNVQDSYKGYEGSGWQGQRPGSTEGTGAGGAYHNRDDGTGSGGKLPTEDVTGKPIAYKEYDVNDRVPGAGRDEERFVIGSDGSVYYSNDHYASFVKIG
ncbi:MAG TPA: ribonuclease [Coriobacteriia bacterium]|nr:ribonuclease [Coriobacteriia bacterium]